MFAMVAKSLASAKVAENVSVSPITNVSPAARPDTEVAVNAPLISMNSKLAGSDL